MMLSRANVDIGNRMPVWTAMTELFLDTELTEVTIAYIARICAASPYSTKDLERILFTEVWPAFLPNLLSVAGEWAGWTDEYIQKRVLECYRPRLYINWKFNPLKRLFCKEWTAIKHRIEQLRNETTG